MAPVRKRTRITLLGDPVSHSLSPLIHNAALKMLGLPFRYTAIRVLPADLPAVVEQIRTGDYIGANVTIPHKENIVPLLDRLTPTAARLEAVNTIKVVQNPNDTTVLLEGDNTDVWGFAWPLNEYAEQLRGAKCLVWGAGGVARAVVYALLDQFEAREIVLVSRSPERAERIRAALDTHESRVRIVAWNRHDNELRDSKLLVNASPVGMSPDTETSPCSDIGVLRESHIVYDLVYNPRQTRLLRDSESRGATTIGGMEMLIRQASQSFLVWTGTQMPVDVVRRALADHMKEHA